MVAKDIKLWIADIMTGFQHVFAEHIYMYMIECLFKDNRSGIVIYVSRPARVPELTGTRRLKARRCCRRTS